MDQIIFNQINQYAGDLPLLDAIGVFCARYLEFFLLGFLFLFLFEEIGKNWKTIIWSLIAAVFARFFIVNLIRLFWARPRPFASGVVNLLFDYPQEPSFPSGHAAFYFALATVVFYKDQTAGVLFFLGAFIICLGRVFAGIHWPSDILVGALIGVFSGWFINKIAEKYNR